MMHHYGSVLLPRGGDALVDMTYYENAVHAMQELMIRIKALAGRAFQPVAETQESFFEIGRYLFNPTNQTLSLLDQTEVLSYRESEILRRLCQNRNQVVNMGIWSCLGISLDEVRKSLYEGKSGIVFSQERKDAGFRSALVGNVPKANLKGILSRNERQPMPEEAQYAYLATKQALEQAQLDDDYLIKHDVGIIYGNDSVAEATMTALDKFRNMKSSVACGSGAIFQSMNSTITMNLACLFHLRGINLTASAAWYRMDEHFDRINIGDKTYCFVQGFKNFAMTLAKNFPEDSSGLEKLATLLQNCSGTSVSHNDFEMQAQVSALQYLHSIINNPLLIDILCTPASVKGEMCRASLPLFTFLHELTSKTHFITSTGIEGKGEKIHTLVSMQGFR